MQSVSFVLCLEILLIKIRKDQDVKGLVIPGRNTENKMSVYADNSDFFLIDEQSISQTFRWYEQCSKESGAKLNINKSRGMNGKTVLTITLE